MRVTKHEHAALTIDEQGKRLLIDPGSYTATLDDLDDVVAVVLTHEHADHWTPAHLDTLREKAPDAPIFAPPGVAIAAADYDITVVNAGDTVEVGPFVLRFFGGKHELIHSSMPIVDNVGILVNEKFYYPGDSYAEPEGADVALLAAPLGAPWLRLSEAMDFVLGVKPRKAFGTHDMTLSVAGRDMHRARLGWATAQHGGEFLALDPGDHVEI